MASYGTMTITEERNRATKGSAEVKLGASEGAGRASKGPETASDTARRALKGAGRDYRATAHYRIEEC